MTEERKIVEVQLSTTTHNKNDNEMNDGSDGIGQQVQQAQQVDFDTNTLLWEQANHLLQIQPSMRLKLKNDIFDRSPKSGIYIDERRLEEDYDDDNNGNEDEKLLKQFQIFVRHIRYCLSRSQRTVLRQAFNSIVKQHMNENWKQLSDHLLRLDDGGSKNNNKNNNKRKKKQKKVLKQDDDGSIPSDDNGNDEFIEFTGKGRLTPHQMAKRMTQLREGRCYVKLQSAKKALQQATNTRQEEEQEEGNLNTKTFSHDAIRQKIIQGQIKKQQKMMGQQRQYHGDSAVENANDDDNNNNNDNTSSSAPMIALNEEEIEMAVQRAVEKAKQRRLALSEKVQRLEVELQTDKEYECYQRAWQLWSGKKQHRDYKSEGQSSSSDTVIDTDKDIATISLEQLWNNFIELDLVLCRRRGSRGMALEHQSAPLIYTMIVQRLLEPLSSLTGTSKEGTVTREDFSFIQNIYWWNVDDEGNDREENDDEHHHLERQRHQSERVEAEQQQEKHMNKVDNDKNTKTTTTKRENRIATKRKNKKNKKPAGEIDMAILYKDRIIAICEMKTSCYEIANGIEQHIHKLKDDDDGDDNDRKSMYIIGSKGKDGTCTTSWETTNVNQILRQGTDGDGDTHSAGTSTDDDNKPHLFVITLLPEFHQGKNNDGEGTDSPGGLIGAEPALSNAICNGLRAQGFPIVDPNSTCYQRDILYDYLTSDHIKTRPAMDADASSGKANVMCADNGDNGDDEIHRHVNSATVAATSSSLLSRALEYLDKVAASASDDSIDSYYTQNNMTDENNRNVQQEKEPEDEQQQHCRDDEKQIKYDELLKFVQVSMGMAITDDDMKNHNNNNNYENGTTNITIIKNKESPAGCLNRCHDAIVILPPPSSQKKKISQTSKPTINEK